MQKYADAATLTLPDSDCTYVFPSNSTDVALPCVCDAPFSDKTIDFLNSLSASILKDRESRAYPDVVTFAFFCRKANLLKLKERHNPAGIHLGRGIVFHIAPGNVPVNFAYSLVAGLLAGNNNVVKLSSRPFRQVDIIIKHIRALADNSVARRIVLVRYPHQSEASAQFSAIADARVIWGGDQTIALIRSYATPPRSVDVCFSDRYSLCVINANAVASASGTDMSSLAEKFYNDTFLFDQNACSAPHMVAWLGESDEAELAKTKFWNAVHHYAEAHYALQPVMAVDKLVALYSQAIDMNISATKMVDNLIVRVETDKPITGIENYRCHSGYFTETTITSLADLTDIITPRYQTMAYYGIGHEQINDFINTYKPAGIDRIVPIGETTAFSLIWDGYNLIDILSRNITIL
ncbi:MAG: acyl-CoA reductase [Muribaculum sp.]|nr:acyl-CoA reductase [Muribaculaceae bacterium]MCM1080135.1 acyl-CoA reductase [Muribaculum sp.]